MGVCRQAALTSSSVARRMMRKSSKPSAYWSSGARAIGLRWGQNGDLMGIHSGFMGIHGDLMGIHGDLMGIYVL